MPVLLFVLDNRLRLALDWLCNFSIHYVNNKIFHDPCERKAIFCGQMQNVSQVFEESDSPWLASTLAFPLCTQKPSCISARIRGAADKSLARPTFRCHRTESIVSLERGVSSCAELQVFLVQRLKGSMSGDAHDFNNIETRAVIKFFFSCKARRRRKFTPF